MTPRTGRRRTSFALLVVAAATVLTGCSLLSGLAGGGPVPVPASSLRPAPPTPTRSVGPVEALFADPHSDAARALQKATQLATADTDRLTGMDVVTISATQRILVCPEGSATPDWHQCLVRAFHYLTWNGEFRDGHDPVIARLSLTCSFAGTAHVDWTPPPGTARLQQGLCPEGPNAWVHWATNSWYRGVEACRRDWYNACGLSTAEIVDEIARHTWQGRVRLSYPLDPAMYVEPEPTGQATADAQGRPNEYAILFGSKAEAARHRAIARAEADTKALSRIAGVTLAGTQQRLDCVEGRDNAGRADSSVRLVCHVQVTQYLTWSGDFARGRSRILTASARICPWRNEPSSFDWRPTNQTRTQQQPNCGETPTMYLDWMKPHAKELVHPCRRDARTSCSPNSDAVTSALLAHDWVARIGIQYQFYKDLY